MGTWRDGRIANWLCKVRQRKSLPSFPTPTTVKGWIGTGLRQYSKSGLVYDRRRHFAAGLENLAHWLQCHQNLTWCQSFLFRRRLRLKHRPLATSFWPPDHEAYVPWHFVGSSLLPPAPLCCRGRECPCVSGRCIFISTSLPFHSMMSNLDDESDPGNRCWHDQN